MANQPNQKLRLLHVLKTLLEKTDYDNGLTTQEIIEELCGLGLEAERKTLYRDFDVLREFGLDVEQRKGKYWYLATRPLELEEMVMLVDALQSSPFLTERLTDKLINRIKKFASVEQKKLLKRRIEVPNRVKMHNEEVLNNLDIIQQALRTKRKVSFTYFHYDTNKKKVLNGDGRMYTHTPVRLVYVDELYYLIVFDQRWKGQPGHSPFTPFRVDRMTHVAVSEEAADKDAAIAGFQTQDYIVPSFGMYAAELTKVALEFDKSVMNPIVDKFGLDALVFKKDNDRAQAYVKVPLSPQFYGWLMQLGPCVKILKPKKAVAEFAALLNRIHKMYNGSYRICSNTARRLITQEQFVELVEHLESRLSLHIDRKLNGDGFKNQNDFDKVAWDILERWLRKHKIPDGLPYDPVKRVMVNGVEKVRSAPVNFDTYASYGQIIGEALVAIEPRKFAAKGCEEVFMDTAGKFNPDDGKMFLFNNMPMNGPREEEAHYRKYKVAPGAYYETLFEESKGKKYMRLFFTAPSIDIPKTKIKPWLGPSNCANDMKGILKHWQMIAYRFA